MTGAFRVFFASESWMKNHEVRLLEVRLGSIKCCKFLMLSGVFDSSRVSRLIDGNVQ